MAHILMIDADPLAAERAAQILIDAGHACGWVSDAASAMKVITRRRPDLLLLDDDLPGVGGTAFLRRLRTSPKFYDLPVMMLSAATGFKEEQIAYYNGVQDYLRKPYGDLMLQFRVKDLLDARANQPPHRPLGERLGAGGAGAIAGKGEIRRIC